MEELKPTRANSTPLTPLIFLERAALVYGDCPSIIYNTTTYTWSETYVRCIKIASAISMLGIQRHHVVSVVSPNVPAAYELHFGVPMAGAILNNINTRLNPTTISMILHHSESKLVFVYHQLQSLVLQALSILPAQHPRPLLVLILDDEDNDSRPSEFATFGTNFTNTKPNVDPKFVTSYAELIKRGDSEFKWVPPESEWDPIALNYTSGTTSSPKGVVQYHRAAYITAIASLLDWFVPKQPVYLWTLPMFHTNGWCFTWAMAAVGATNICLRQVNSSTIYNAIRRYQVTHFCAAPVVISMLINQAEKIDNPVHILTAGSSPPPFVILQAEKLGFVVSHGYGLTETAGVTVSCDWKPNWRHFPPNQKAVLRARQGVRNLGMADVQVLDLSTNKPVNHDGKTIGEVVMRGSCIMLGYLKNSKETSKCMGKDGWFRTGDLGVMHPDGYLEIKDRSKDIIISGGENISSVEVESVLYSYPNVKEAAVVAEPHQHWGETPCAFVCLNNDVIRKPTEKEIIEYCRDKIPHYMVPKRVVFKDELPKTSTGKIQKNLLREIAKGMVRTPLHPSSL